MEILIENNEKLLFMFIVKKKKNFVVYEIELELLKFEL